MMNGHDRLYHALSGNVPDRVPCLPKIWIDLACKLTNRVYRSVRIYCHICGDVMPILEKLVETGVDCIGPLDPLGGVDPSAVRNIVGDDVALLGGVNTLSFISEDPEHIVSESRYCIESAGAHGGYVLSSGCVLPRDSKAENIRALRDAVIRYGVYDHGNLMHTHR